MYIYIKEKKYKRNKILRYILTFVFDKYLFSMFQDYN